MNVQHEANFIVTPIHSSGVRERDEVRRFTETLMDLTSKVDFLLHDQSDIAQQLHDIEKELIEGFAQSAEDLAKFTYNCRNWFKEMGVFDEQLPENELITKLATSLRNVANEVRNYSSEALNEVPDNLIEFDDLEASYFGRVGDRRKTPRILQKTPYAFNKGENEDLGFIYECITTIRTNDPFGRAKEKGDLGNKPTYLTDGSGENQRIRYVASAKKFRGTHFVYRNLLKAFKQHHEAIKDMHQIRYRLSKLQRFPEHPQPEVFTIDNMHQQCNLTYADKCIRHMKRQEHHFSELDNWMKKAAFPRELGEEESVLDEDDDLSIPIHEVKPYMSAIQKAQTYMDTLRFNERSPDSLHITQRSFADYLHAVCINLSFAAIRIPHHWKKERTALDTQHDKTGMVTLA